MYSSLLQGFPSQGSSVDTDIYHQAAMTHIRRLEPAMKDSSFLASSEALLSVSHIAGSLLGSVDVLTTRQHVDPAKHSLSYLALLTAAWGSPSKGTVSEAVLEHTIKFVFSFDARQMRYGSTAFCTLLERVGRADFLPVSEPSCTPSTD